MVDVLALRALRPDGRKEDADDRDIAVDGDNESAMEEVRVEEDDDDLRHVEEDGEDEIGDGDIVERPDALCP